MLCHYRLLAACVIRGEGITRVYLPSDAPAFYINKCTSVSSMASNTKAGIVSRLRCSEANHLNLGPHLLHSALSSPSNMFPLTLCFPVPIGPTAGTCRAVGDRSPLCAASWGLSAWSQLFSPIFFPGVCPLWLAKPQRVHQLAAGSSSPVLPVTRRDKQQQGGILPEADGKLLSPAAESGSY